MQLLTQNLPSGKHYTFEAIEIKPMNFAQILEYLENVPDEKKNPVERYYFDYCLIKEEDPNIDNLLLIDMEYVLYMKKALTVSENLTFRSRVKCPKCGNELHYQVSLAGVEWNHMDAQALNGLNINFGGQFMTVRMPTVFQFMEAFKKYRLYKKVTDLRIIKLITLFESSEMYLQRVEDLVINATYKDMSALFMLDSIYYNFVKPKELFCSKCAKMYEPSDSELDDLRTENNIKPEDDIPSELIEGLKHKHGVVEIGMESTVSEFFRDVYENNRLTEQEILPREIRKDAQS